jgi:7-cyano-7-deazaguanine synthase
MNKHAIAIVSGGLDSITMVAELQYEGWQVDMLSFNYGQRHKHELIYAMRAAKEMDCRHDIVDVSSLSRLLDNSALTSGGGAPSGTAFPKNPDIEVPEGHYAEETMKATVVPNRNMIMLSIACGVAVYRRANTVAIGVHSGDHFIYPDCRPKFIFAAGVAMLEGNEGLHNFWIPDPDPALMAAGLAEGATRPIITPWLFVSKADIAFRALELGVVLHHTYSCYKGGPTHCGRCGTCVERLEAIDVALKRFAVEYADDPERVARATDLTSYDDWEYWRTVVHTESDSDEDGNPMIDDHSEMY